MSRRFQRVTVTGTGGATLAEGDVVTGSDIDNVVVMNGLVKVTLEISAIVAQRGACHFYRWNGSTYQRANTTNYGDYTYFTNTPHARPDRVRIVTANGNRVELAIEWDAYSLVDAGTYPNGIANRDYSGNLNYAQGAVNPNWKYITATHLVKTVIVERGREGYFTGYHSDPLIGPVASRIPTDNNDSQSWGEREMGLGEDSEISASSGGASFTRRHPDIGGTSGFGIDDPPLYGGAEQTTGPWWAISIPRAASVCGGLCRYIALRQRLMILPYQFGGGAYGLVTINGVNEAHDENGVPYESMIFIGAFPYTVSDFDAEEAALLAGTSTLLVLLAEKCPDDFDASGVPSESEATFDDSADALEQLATQIVSAEPDTLSTWAFTSFRESTASRGGIEAWAQRNPSDGLRYFAVRIVSSEESEEDNGTLVTAECECVVAYPIAAEYGSSDAETVAAADFATIADALDSSDDIGCSVTATTTEVQGRVVFGTTSFTAQFWTA